MHKLFCVRPRNATACQAAQSSGINKLELVSFRHLSEVGHTIEKFLCTLKPPICLVARNGDESGFPLL
ncbi:hypothetical protein V5799_012128 [Amblyomma americanum]|uniref:Uncharacterized protein n=1 Tax=Amblyomma americanum TaxID=6943 RepID=A0AAQ4EF93_AMBAM